MTLRTRRILLAICVAFFLALSPILTLYTFGFRYDLREKKIVQTGIIYITPFPSSGIKIFLDGREKKDNLSVKGILKKDYVVYNLLPGTYKLKVEKNGYWEWKKNLIVLPGAITYAQPLLLPQNPSSNLVFSAKSVIGWSFSPDYSKIAYLKKESEETEIGVYDANLKKSKIVKIGEIMAMPDSANTDAKIFWSPNSENFALVLGKNPPRIIFVNSRDMSYAEVSLVSDAVDWAEWNIPANSFLYLSSNQKLYSINLKSAASVSTLVTDDVYGFTAKNTGIYYLDNKTLFLYRIDPVNLGAKQQLSFEPLKLESDGGKEIYPADAQKNARLIVSAKNYVAALTPDKKLFLVKYDGVPIYVGNNVESAKFSKEDEFLLYNSHYEIFTYSLSDGTQNLITRLIGKIENVGWYRDYKHIWFTAGNTLKNIEFDSRPVPNIIDFFDYPSAPSSKVDVIYNNDSGDIYYAVADKNNELAVYQLGAE